jgi:hypothetical protein
LAELEATARGLFFIIILIGAPDIDAEVEGIPAFCV